MKEKRVDYRMDSLLENTSILIGNLQRFSLHDGPGIRTTVFLIGCSLRCPWCCNPENLSGELREKYGFDNSTVKSDCYTLKEVYDILIRDKTFYASGGGITYSGGEALLQADKLLPLIRQFNSEGINQCIETGLFAPKESLETVIPYIDEFYVDIKILQPEQCRNILGGDVYLYKDNLEVLKQSGADVTFRMPLVAPYTINEENLQLISETLERYGAKKIEIFRVHNLAEKKYKKIGIDFNRFDDVSEAFIESWKEKLRGIVANVEFSTI